MPDEARVSDRKKGERVKQRIALSLFTAAAFSGCAFSSETSSNGQSIAPVTSAPVPSRNPVVRAVTDLPAQYDKTSSVLADVETLQVGGDLVSSATTIRPRTEIRTGPGIEFNLSDFVLNAGERVIVYELVGAWRRIVSPARGIRGWAHRGTLRFDRHDSEKNGVSNLEIGRAHV